MRLKLNIDISKKKHTIILIICISILFAVFGFLFYNYVETHFREEKQHELKAIADLKINQIAQWHNDKIGNADVLANSPFSKKAVQELVINSNNLSLKESLKERMLLCKESYNYEDIFLVSTNGKMLLNIANYHNLDITAIDKYSMYIAKKKISFTDFYYCPTHKKIHYDIVSPVFNETGIPVAAFIMRIDPKDYLYPLIETWPTPSLTSETMIVRKENDSVLYLNETRFLKNTALIYRNSLNRKDLPSVQAVLGYKGIFEGVDYRNNKVLADIRPVPGTPWFMVTKVDQSEIYSELYIIAGVIGGFIVILILLTSAGFFYFYSSRNKNIYLDLYNKEKELWQSQEKFKVTLDSIGDAVITTNTNGNIEYMNTMAENLTGWSYRDARGRKLDEIYPIRNEETGNKENNVVQKVMKHGIIKELANHTILICKNGKEIPVMDTGAPIFNADGSIIGIVLAFQDETEKRSQQRLLKESEKRYRTTLDNMLEGGQIIGHDWRYLYLNDTADIHNKRPKEELLGNKYMDMWPGIEQTEVFVKIKKSMEERIPQKMVNEFIYPDGSIGWFELSFQPVPEGIFILSNDITEQRRAVDEIVKAKEKAEEMNRLKSSFLANMSHELRTPMNGILGFSEILQLEEKLDIVRDIANVINKSGKRLMNTLNSILNLSHIESGEVKPESQIVNIIDVVYNSVELIRNEADKKGLKLYLESNVDSLYTLSDERMLSEIISNLINNAVKFTQEGSIKVNISNENIDSLEWAIIEVTDTGIGIEESDYGRIFDEFRQVSEGLSRSFEGTGLGLTICKKYVNLLKGSISVKSKINEGSVFTFKIPLEVEKISDIINKSEDLEKPFSEEIHTLHQNKPFLLYVEDDPTSIQLIDMFLRDNCTIDVATNAEQAVKKAKGNNYLMILMDINLGKGSNGIDATREIRKLANYKDTPIIAVTAFAMHGDRDEFLESGCTDYLSKPFEKNELFNIINKYIKNE
ncbi:MAG: PAS domain S-box protein [Ignavibacteriae bacterium]|nr:PAS domain S-box protein [Ignavibacteriota bacterium]